VLEEHISRVLTLRNMITLFRIEFDGILGAILLKVSVCDLFC